MFGGNGTWWMGSESDPRWNREGGDWVGLGFDWEALIDRLKKKLGEPPEDLQFGWVKD